MALDLTRRTFVQVGLSGMAVLMLPVGCARLAGDGSGATGVAGATGDAAGRFLSAHEFDTVQALADLIIPPDRDPGGAAMGIADYIDFLLGAFGVDPPRIYAAGPLSGRHGGENNFRVYLPLSRVKEIAWRTRLEGSKGLPEREFAGPVKGWQQIYTEGVAQLDTLAQRQYGMDFVGLPAAERGAIKAAADQDFIMLVFGHCVEGAYAAPEYGGNRSLAGWKSIGYEGDRQPIGYNRKQTEEADPGGSLTNGEINEAIEYLKELGVRI